MNKLALLLSLALLAACGGGGTSGSPNVGGQPASQLKMASLNVKVNDPNPKILALGPNESVTPSNRLRIVISNPNFSINGVAFKNISTYPLSPLPPINYSLPVANGYKIEAFSYYKAANNWLKKYGVVNSFNVDATGAAVTVTPIPIDVKIAFTGYSSAAPTGSRMTASSSQKTVFYNISTSGKTAPLGAKWNLVRSDASIPVLNSYTGGTISYDSFITLNTPESYTGGTIYALGEFYIDPFYLKSGESATSFKYIYPNNVWGDSDVSQKYSAIPVPSGGITLGGTW